MELNQLIKELREHESCILCQQAADKLEWLRRLIDDLCMDHYVDYLEFYTNRCRELEEELEKCQQ